MPPSADLFAFVAAALVLLLTPGPAVLLLVTRSLQGGGSAGHAAVFGHFAGGLVHATAAVLGLSAIVASSAELFTARQIAQLGLLFLVLALATNSLDVASSSSLRLGLSKRPAWARRQRYLVGATYLGLGFATAISGRKSS